MRGEQSPFKLLCDKFFTKSKYNMKTMQLTYAEIEQLQFILKTYARAGIVGIINDSMLSEIENLQLKLITMRAQMEYEKRD